MSPDDVDDGPGVYVDDRTGRGDATAAEASLVGDVVQGDVEAVAPSVRDARWWVALGVLLLGLGALAVAGVRTVPGVSGGSGQLLIVAALATVVGLIALARRASGGTDQAEPDAVEHRGSVVVPGSEFDDVLTRAVHGVGGRRTRARREVLKRLSEAAVAIVAHAERVPVERARERVEAGTWTDDERAASLLSADRTAVSAATDQVRSLLGRPTELSTRVDAVIAALTDLAPGVEHGDPSAAADAPAATDTTEPDRAQVDRRTGRWRGLAGLALLALAFGLYAGTQGLTPSLVVAAAAVVGAAGYVYLSSPPDPELAVERSLSPAEPAPGERVTVTVTVTNDGDDLLPDLRLVDGVPPGLLVVDGSPRYATALRPGESVSFDYVVEAARGRHAFEPLHAIARNFSGALERERYVAAAEPVAVTAPLELAADAEVPVHPHTARQVGRVVTDTGGSGVELHSVREYRRGDPLSRIDWNRVAATGEFATLQFREEHAATVVLLLDARQEAYVAPRVDARSAVEWEVAAADVVLSSLIAAGDSVGLAALSPDWCWLEPRGGRGQQARARRLLETHPAFDGRRPEGAFYGRIEERRLRRELPGDAQLVLLSPLCDDTAVSIARQLHARDYPVTVISPDVTAAGTTGQRLAAVERGIRISMLRRVGVRVIDWDTDRPLQTAIEAAERRWSA